MTGIERTTASERMTKAWKDMAEDTTYNSLALYNQMSFEGVSELMKKNCIPEKENEQYIVKYLRALSDWLNHTG